jgi:hypothetical protein
MATKKPTKKPKGEKKIEQGKNTAFVENKWEPGQSGNPKGRPKGSPDGLRARMNAVLRKKPHADILKEFEDKGIIFEVGDNAEVIAEVANQSARLGNVSAIKFMAEFTESPMDKSISVSTTGGVLVIPPGTPDIGEWIKENKLEEKD